MNINQLSTPCLLIDQQKMRKNIKRLADHIGALRCHLRPHVKTHKSLAITKEVVAAGYVSGLTVSTLKEAETFFNAGYTDIMYAVGIVANKFEKIRALISNGCDLKVVLDNEQTLDQLAQYVLQHNFKCKVVIELDVDGHRSGADPNGQALLDIAQKIGRHANLIFMGVMTHAGGSYECFSFADQQRMAIQERDLTLLAVSRLKKQGIHCNIVSIGSTPTAFAYDNLNGITEVRAGVYVTFDLVMAGLGVCKIDDIAISVLGSVIGFQQDKNLAIIDAGWMAMSRDRGTADHPVDQGYGVVCDTDTTPIVSSSQDDLIISSANQEHGLITVREKTSAFPFHDFNVGKMVRILPNHACSTAAQFQTYYLLENDTVLAEIESVTGW